MREELTGFLQAATPKTRAAFFAALGMELSVLARITYSKRRGDKTALMAMQEMQHTCFGQINAFLQGNDDLMPPDTAVAILYQYVGEAAITDEFEAAIPPARKLAAMA